MTESTINKLQMHVNRLAEDGEVSRERLASGGRVEPGQRLAVFPSMAIC